MSDPVVVALDVGGTGMKCALVRPDGTVHHAERHPTGRPAARRRSPRTSCDVAAGLADRARADGLDPVAAGVAVPGVVDEADRRRGLVGERGLPRRTAAGSGLRPARRARRARPRRARRRHRRGPPRRRPRPAARAVHRDRHRHRRRARGRRHGVRRRARRGRRGRPRRRAARRPAVRLRRARLPGVGGVGRPRSAAATPSCPASPARPPPTWPPGPPPASRWRTAVWTRGGRGAADGLLTAQALYDAGGRGARRRAGRGRRGAARPAADRAATQRITFHRVPQLVRAALGDTAGCLGAALLALDDPRMAALDGRDQRPDRPARRQSSPGTSRSTAPTILAVDATARHAGERRRSCRASSTCTATAAAGTRSPPATPTRPGRRPRSTCGTAPPRCWPAWSARRTS